MIDIHFYRKIHGLKQSLMGGATFEMDALKRAMEENRSPEPVIYNIETTNACNMTCKMCPRTTMMTRPIQTLDMPTFERIIDQIRPYSREEWNEWQDFAEKAYGVSRQGMSENHFFLFVIPRVIVLHGYGDPLLDPLMPRRIKYMKDKGVPSYFSCNPANIDREKTLEMMKNGLGFIKYSIESVDDSKHREIRGKASNFSKSYESILEVIEDKEKHGLKTTIVITMLNLEKSGQGQEFARLVEAFAGKDVYIYLKSQDQLWYGEEEKETQSIHWQEFCQFPWSSITVKSDGKVAMCVEDFNNEIILGDARIEKLKDIWNGEKYEEFRRHHFEVKRGIKCSDQCDMKLIGQLIG
ncbi:MAG TPA: SPASM domain-containing protein [Chroococcales cyanobacterium]|jgi:radical SAM protein with 4Fe4S-binding SPASM domain